MFRRPDALVMLSLALVIAAVRSRSFHEPPEWDVGTYLVVAHELNAGERLYHDIWDSKPPAIFVTYALAERVLGYGYAQTYWLSVVAAWVTMLGIYTAASVEGRAAGRWAALFWAMVCFEPLLGANQPNTEAFINAAVAWAVALLVRDGAGAARWGRYVTGGLLLALATFYKQVAMAPAAMLSLAHVVWPPRELGRRRAVIQSITMLLIVVLAWAAVYAYFALTGRAWVFAQTMFVHPRWYGGNALVNVARSFQLDHLFPSDARFVLPLLLAALLVFLPQRDPAPSVRRSATPRRSRGILLCAAIGTHLAIALPGQFFDHYYQLWLPILCLAAAWGVVRLGTLVAPRARWVAPALGAVVAICLIQPQFSWFALPGDAWAARKHGGFYPTALRDAREIAATLKPGDTIYAWSDEAWLYFIAKRRVPAVGLWKSHTLHGPLSKWLARRTVEDLDRNPPDVFIDWVNLPAPDNHPVARWFKSRYRPLDGGKTRWPFVVYVRGS